MTETTTPPLDSEILAMAREAGAHDLFVMVAAVGPEAVEISHNYVADELAHTLVGVPDDERTEWLEADKDLRGDFWGALWDGDLAEALYRADGTNSRLLFRLLSDDVMMSALIEERGSYESAHRWFQPNAERYGWESAEMFHHE